MSKNNPKEYDASEALAEKNEANSLQDEYDECVLHRAVADAGRWSFGSVLVEMWVLSDNRTCLYRPKAGWWVDPVYHENCQGTQCQICCLVNPNVPGYIPPAPLAPGEGLPGVLWAESNSTGGGSPGTAPPTSASGTKDATFTESTETRKVVWRQIQMIAQDPDQPWNPRLRLLADLGLGWAAAVSFRFNNTQGIVVYMARAKVDQTRLMSPKNEAYLKSATDFAGAAFALRQPRREMVQDRFEERAHAWRRIRTKILTLRYMNCDLEQLVNDNSSKKPEQMDSAAGKLGKQPTGGISVLREWLVWTRQKAVVTLRKTQGGGSQAPPPFTLRQTLLTFVGAFSSLLMVTRLSYYMIRERGRDYAIVLGPLGALATLHYGLSAAPASQPRNALLGQIVPLSIAMAIGYADESLDLYLRQSLATALSIAVMVRLGITHPPAGAAALIFSSGAFEWTHVLMMMVGNVIAIGTATVVNNISERRQYPMFWGVGFVDEYVSKKKTEEMKKTS